MTSTPVQSENVSIIQALDISSFIIEHIFTNSLIVWIESLLPPREFQSYFGPTFPKA